MTDTPASWLLSTKLEALLSRLRQAQDDEGILEDVWKEADAALASAEAEEDEDLALTVWERDLEGLSALLAAWEAGTRPLAEWDKAVLKRAFKAYKKRLKLVRLDDESTAGANPLSAGRESTILGVRPPEQYPSEVWAILVKQGKLRDGGASLLELGTN